LSAATFALIGTATAVAADAVNVGDGLALRGFDPVAYFVENKAVQGSPDFKAQYMGATYEFASKEDQAAFVADPAKFAPQYGGFCAAATSHGKKVDADPKAYAINNGKLYVNYNDAARDSFQKDVNASIKAADEKWPQVKEIEDVIR
jgi:YHS domain-containing protein